jgi:uncharacterized protein (TIGR00251 family)
VIQLETHASGVVIHVKAHAGARKNAITGEHDGALKISVTQKPEKGKANKAIITVLAETLGVSRGAIEILAGETSSQKRLLVRGISPTELQARLANR